MDDVNPLLDLGFAIPFHDVRPEHVGPAVDALIAAAQARLDAIKAVDGTRTWDDTPGALDVATEALGTAWGVVSHLRSVVHTPALDEAHAAALPKVAAFFARIPLDPALYAAVRDYAATDEAQALEGPRRRFLDKTLDEFVRNGAALDDDAKGRLQVVQQELAETTSAFSRNLLASTAAWHLDVDDEARLAGLPDDARAMLKDAAERAGVEGWRFTLSAPVVVAGLTHLEDATLREALWRAWNRRGRDDHDNVPLLDRILALRAEQARILGHAHFADFVLEDRMAHDGATALGFLQDLEARARPAAARETEALRAFREAAVDGSREVAPWDVSWLAEKQRKAEYALDEEALKPFFPFPKVLSGVFELLHRLYGVRVEATDLPVWHDTVSAWALHDADGTHLGSFYTDFVPRPEKRDGAWMNAFHTGGPRAEGFAPHLGLVCGNLTPPSSGRPALLTHREVETIVHEVGHLVHHLLSTVELRSQAGTNVAWDFVELPSQIMENWCWTREGLDLLSGHHETGEPLPDALFERLLATRTFRRGSFLLRQLSFGLTDLALHMDHDPARDGTAYAHASRLMDRLALVEGPDDHCMITSFGHLWSSPTGYAAGYYSYLWAAVLDADAFAVFEEHGVFDRETGRRFRDTVLSRGDTEDPAELFRRFRGRDPDPAAMLRREGLSAA